MPTPNRPISCGELGSLSLITTAPFFVPVDCGSKVTPMVQLDPPLSLLPEAGQVLVAMAKSVVSFKVIVPMVIAVVPVLATVTLLTALFVFTSSLPKFTGAPVMEMAVPDPVNEMLEVELKKPFVVMATVPVAVPEPVGVK